MQPTDHGFTPSFEQLFTVDPLSGQLPTAGLQTLDADPPIDETAPSIGDVKEAVAKLRGGNRCGKVEGWKGSWHLQYQC